MQTNPLAPAVLIFFVAATIGMRPAFAEPRVSETIKYYDVTGVGARDIRANLNRSGPLDKGERFDAFTRWDVSWSYKYAEANGRCGIASAATEVKVAITFPRLKPDPARPAAVATSFANFAEKLMLHEKGHVQNGINIARRIENGIRALPQQPSCKVLETVANKLGDALIKEANQADIDYDARTEHGGKQGVKFP